MKSDPGSPTPARPASSRSSGGRRAPTSPTKIPAGPPIGKIAPYVAAALTVVGLVFLVRTPRFAPIGTLAIATVTTSALAYFAIAGRLHLPPEDRLRLTMPLVALVVAVCAVVPFAYTVYPPHPQGTVSISENQEQSVNVSGSAISVWLTVRGRFVPSATGNANYFLTISRDGGPPEHVDGTLRPHAGGPLPVYHLLEAHGPGRYAIRMEQVSSSVALPLSLDVTTRPFSTWLLVLLYGALAIAVFAIDTMLWRRGVEPAFAASLLLPLIAAVYFQHNLASNALTTDLITAAIIGALGGVIGGEILGRIVRGVVGK